MHQALYRKYRPRTFTEVCGQSQVTDVLRFEVAKGRYSHAFLFCGSRGTGKTSCAKILAKALNCENPVDGNPCLKCPACLGIDAGNTTDVVELDAASNNGVDNIRDLCDEAAYTPAMLSKKVYIIDEVHMLSQGAFNALLKTIEEPPEHVVFILATTELNKIPATIVSRCQRFDFRRINMRTIADRLMYIAASEGFVLENEAALLIARQAQGGMRDAIGLCELCAAGGNDVTAALASEVLGLSGYDCAAEVFTALAGRDMAKLFELVAKANEGSRDIAVFWQELISFARDMLVSKYSTNITEYLDITDSEAEILKAQAEKFNLATLIYYCHILDEAMARMSRSPQTKRSVAELSLLRMCRPELDTSTEALSARISKLEDMVALGKVSVSATVPTESAPATKAEAPAAPAPVQKVQKVEVSTAPQRAMAESDPDRVFDLVRDISEAVGKLEGTNRGLSNFLSASKSYVSRSGKRLKIIAEGFAANMLSTDSAKQAISQAFALAKLTDGPALVIIEKASTASSVSKDIADELSELL